jgi:Holliday junction DNA helicase RuvA
LTFFFVFFDIDDILSRKKAYYMIVGIEGTIELKEPTQIHINVNGLIYQVNISINTSNAIDNNKVKLHTTQIIREDTNMLYGFMTLNEKKMFDTLIKINGIGPKVALAICSTFMPESFAKVISNKDVSMLKRVPGIGPKAASRILVELADFIVDSDKTQDTQDKNEAIMALESLGFKKDAITKALENESGDTASLVKTALKKLQRL